MTSPAKSETEAVVAELHARLRREIPPTVSWRWVELKFAMLTFAIFKRPESEQARIFEILEQGNPDQVEAIRVMQRTIIEAIEQRAEKQGELRAARRALTSLLRSRLGTCPDALAGQIADFKDPDQLHAAFERALGVDDLTGFRLRE